MADLAEKPGSEPAVNRQRCPVSAERLATVLRPHVTCLRWLKYGQNMRESPVRPEVITAKAQMIHDLYTEQANLSFTQNNMIDVFTQILDEVNAKWELPLTEKEKEEWPVAHAWKVRTICRHVSQAMARPRQPHWLISLCLNEAAKPGLSAKPELSDESCALCEVIAELPAEPELSAKPELSMKPEPHGMSGPCASANPSASPAAAVEPEYAYDKERHRAVKTVEGKVVEASIKFKYSTMRKANAGGRYMEARRREKQTSRRNKRNIKQMRRCLRMAGMSCGTSPGECGAKSPQTWKSSWLREQ
jgi:hypothetical protein